MQNFNGYVPVAKLQELGKGFTIWECEKDGISYEILHIPYSKEQERSIKRILEQNIKPLIDRNITGIQKIVDAGDLGTEGIFIAYENSEENLNDNPLEIMRDIAIGLNELKRENREKFIISPQKIKNKLQFIGLFELFRKFDLLDKRYLSPNVNEWLKNNQGMPPNFQDDIYSLIKSFEIELMEIDNDEAKEILEKGLAEERTDRFSKYNDLIDLLKNICRKKLKALISNEEFSKFLDEMNESCAFKILPEKNPKGQIVVEFCTNNRKGKFSVDDRNYIFIFYMEKKEINKENILKFDSNWFEEDFSFSLNEESNFNCVDFFTEKFENIDHINQLASLNKIKKEAVEKWKVMPEKEKEFIEENSFCVEYENVIFEKTNAIFSLTKDLKDWEAIKKLKKEETPLFATSSDGETIKIGKIGDFYPNDKKLIIKDPLCKKEEIGEEGKLKEDIQQKISQFKKQMEACDNFSKSNICNPILCSILATPETPIPSSKKLEEWNYDSFRKNTFNENLRKDETQLEAVLEAISYKPIYLVQGPPGTGKTTVIVECIRQIIKREPNSKILVTSQSNLAVDNVLEKIAEIKNDKQDLKFMRLASENEDGDMNVTDSIKPHTYEAKLKEWVKETSEKHEEFMKSKFHEQEKNRVLFEFYKDTQGISGNNEIEKFNVFKKKLNKQHNNYIKKLFENSKTMKNAEETFNKVLGEEYLKLKHIGEEWKSFIGNTTNKDKKRQSKLNNGSEEIDFLTAMINDMSVIGATCIHIASSKYAKINFKFDYVIMDESSKASPAETLVPINMGKNIILIGDHKQLPPVVTREDAIKRKVKEELEDNGLDIEKEFGESLFEKLITAFEADEAKQNYIKMLNIQYRMPSQIGSLISKFFYDEKLKNPLPEAIPDFEEKHGHGLKLKKDSSVIFLSTSKEEKPNDNGNKSKRENQCNMKYIKEILEKLNGLFSDNLQKEKPFTIGIIAGYRGQVELLRNSIKREQYKNFVQIDKNGDKNCLIEINTVDKFQGAERDIIIYDIVRSDKNVSNIGFLDDDRRINVAFSRVKRLLIVVGDSEYIIKRAKPNPGEGGIFKKFKLKEIVSFLDKEGFIFNSLEEVF